MKRGEMLRKEAGNDTAGTGKRKSIRDVPGQLCHIGVYIFLFFFVAVYVFYAPEGYIQIATNKFQFYRKMVLVTGAVMVPIVVLHYLFFPRRKREEGRRLSLSPTDIFVLLFLAVNGISFFFTEYREEAVWGTSGWYMGFAMMLSFTGIYFMLSRFYDGKIDLMPFFMAVTSVVFLWGLLNRFSVYPIDMQYDSTAFISCIGNINWFCGYWSVFFMIGAVLYVVGERMSLRIISAVSCTLALATGAVEGSDSAFISMAAVYLFLFWIAFRKTVYMKRLLDEGIFYCTACQIMRVIAAFGPDELSEEEAVWGGLNLAGGMTKLMLGNLTLAVLVIFLVLRIWLEKEDRKYTGNGAAGEREPKPQLIRKFIWLRNTVIGLTAAAAVIYLALLMINTRTPGILGPLSKYPALLFDGAWGSNRGRTWRDGLIIYRSLPLKKRLFGVGPDCFSAYAYSVPDIAEQLKEQWPSSRLTNAHNECITFLVDLGIFGLLSFIGIFWSSFRRLVKKAEEEPVCCVFAASLLSYFFHNQFSFSQVMNIPYIFMMLGLAENLMRRADMGKTEKLT